MNVYVGKASRVLLLVVELDFLKIERPILFSFLGFIMKNTQFDFNS